MQTQFTFTPAQIREAINWLNDCGFEDITLSDLLHFDSELIVKAINKFYNGGVPAFILATN